MKEGYIPKDQRKKILLITDDIRLPSGVGGVGKDIILNTCHHYNWVNIGGAVKHPDAGKRFDLSSDTNKESGINDSSITIYPTSGYGDPILLRNLISIENPDAIMLITDPRYFEWLFSMENEIRKKIPVIYLNIWDNYPAPSYNKEFYESCDALLGISKQTTNINNLVLREKAKDKVIDYIPHGVSSKYYFPIEKDNKDLVEFRNKMLGGREKDFVLLFNSRNIRRKSIPDTMFAWKMFIDQLPKEKADKCAFVLHTQPSDQNGTDLIAVKDYLFGEEYNDIIFSTSRLPINYMNLLYNSTDAQILLSSNEGWGLSLTEALLVGNPIIANVTGGMQDQMRFEDNNGNWFTPDDKIPSNHTGKYKKCGKWAFPVFPSSRSIQGSPKTPYIWDDRCNAEDAASQIMSLYKLSSEERKELGEAGREWAIGEEAGFTAEIMGNRVINSVDTLFSTWKPRNRYEIFNPKEFTPDKINHKLVY
jgi:glycosyltransferase involved in cell wall biosynthesis